MEDGKASEAYVSRDDANPLGAGKARIESSGAFHVDVVRTGTDQIRDAVRQAIVELLADEDNLIIAADTAQHVLFVPRSWRDISVLATACDTSSRGSDTRDLLHFEFKDANGPLTLRLYVGAAPQALRQRAIDLLESEMFAHLFEGRAKTIHPVHGRLWGVTIYSGPERKVLTGEQQVQRLEEAWQRNRKHIDRLTSVFAEHFAP